MPPRSLRDPAGRADIIARLGRLTPDSPRVWGKMDFTQLLPHLAAALQLALGERKIEGKSVTGLKAAVFRQLAIHHLPWPQGKIQSPGGTFNNPTDGWERDRERVITLIERFAVTPPAQLASAHPPFGRMRANDWDVLQYRHLDHHLRQFGA
jgi:hypothetical protein